MGASFNWIRKSPFHGDNGGSSPPVLTKKNKTKVGTILKEIRKDEIKKLIDNGILKCTENGLVDKKGELTGFYRTKHHRYIEDKYVNIAQRIK